MINKKYKGKKKTWTIYKNYATMNMSTGEIKKTHELQAFVANLSNGAMKVMDSQTVQQWFLKA